MLINSIMAENKISVYRLSKRSGIPYATINDICNNKVNLAKCNAETIYKLAKELNVSMEELLEPYVLPRPAFEIFKSNVTHSLKELGDIDFLIKTIESDEITVYYGILNACISWLWWIISAESMIFHCVVPMKSIAV